MTIRFSLPKQRPRNPVALAGRLRHAGAHGTGSCRQRARLELRREIERLRDTT